MLALLLVAFLFQQPPQLTRISPAAAAPGTRIRLEGFRLGANLNKGVRVFFTQGAAEYETTAKGSSYQADLDNAPQSLNVAVPNELQPGPSQVLVEVEGRRSSPLALKIEQPAIAPVLECVRPSIAQPGELLWIHGSGFSDSDEFELIDADGKTHHAGNGRGTSGADVSAFRLAEDFAAGETRVRVTEHRSGTNQLSNTVTFTVVRGPAPLDLVTDCMAPVAPGQWLALMVTSDLPIKDAERVEVAFQQQERFLTVSIENPKQLRVQVPASLSPGTARIQTRTFVAGEASAWSAPADFSLLEKPAAAKIYTIEIRPVRAEAAFKQGDRIVATTVVPDSDYPSVRVPADQLSPGNVSVLTRVWRGGQPSPWLYENYGFDWPSKFLPDGTMGAVPFMKELSVSAYSKSPLVVYPGEALILFGTFPVESPAHLQVTLKSAGHAPVPLQPTALTDPISLRINLPADLAADDWEVVLNNDGASTRLPIKLRLVRVAEKS